MKGSVSDDTEVKASAADVWEVYSSLRLVQICIEDMPDVVAAYELIKGDGGEGSVVKIVFPAGTPGLGYFVEKIVRVDHEARVKVAEQIEGGYLGFGFKSYAVRSQIINKPDDGSGLPSCVVRTTIDYETIEEGNADQAALISAAAFSAIAEAVGKRLGVYTLPLS